MEQKPVFCLGDICADLILPFAAAKQAARGEAVPLSATDVEFRHGGSVANTPAPASCLASPARPPAHPAGPGVQAPGPRFRVKPGKDQEHQGSGVLSKQAGTCLVAAAPLRAGAWKTYPKQSIQAGQDPGACLSPSVLL